MHYEPTKCTSHSTLAACTRCSWLATKFVVFWRFIKDQTHYFSVLVIQLILFMGFTIVTRTRLYIYIYMKFKPLCLLRHYEFLSFILGSRIGHKIFIIRLNSLESFSLTAHRSHGIQITRKLSWTANDE